VTAKQLKRLVAATQVCSGACVMFYGCWAWFASVAERDPAPGALVVLAFGWFAIEDAYRYWGRA
jgi:hypothetical protein